MEYDTIVVTWATNKHSQGDELMNTQRTFHSQSNEVSTCFGGFLPTHLLSNCKDNGGPDTYL